LKRLDLYLLKNFAKPFFATFFVILFVLVIFTLWHALDEITGKGIGLGYIIKFLYYVMLTVLPLALPIAMLLSSIMALGTMSENYEYAAIKSSGISYYRSIRPLLFLAIILSGVNLFVLDYVFPYAVKKQKNLLYNIKVKEPALALVPGTFNTEIPNYIIKFDEKYGEEGNLLKNVAIQTVEKDQVIPTKIIAKRGKINNSSEKYLAFELEDGYFYQEQVRNKSKKDKKQKMPFAKAHFDKYLVNIDISTFSNESLEDENKLNHEMFSLKQLRKEVDSLEKTYHKYIKVKGENIALKAGYKTLYQEETDSICLSLRKEQYPTLDNFSNKDQKAILSTAHRNLKRQWESIKSSKDGIKWKRKILNLYTLESYKRIATSFSVLILFFIGASLGAIIRKGGFGLPMVIAIVIYVVYFFTGDLAKNMAEESSLTAPIAGWLSTIIFLPIGLLLMYKANNDIKIFKTDLIVERISRTFAKVKFKKNKKSHVS
jgi:lipopolysaccharide export system permease protein